MSTEDDEAHHAVNSGKCGSWRAEQKATFPPLVLPFSSAFNFPLLGKLALIEFAKIALLAVTVTLQVG